MADSAWLVPVARAVGDLDAKCLLIEPQSIIDFPADVLDRVGVELARDKLDNGMLVRPPEKNSVASKKLRASRGVCADDDAKMQTRSSHAGLRWSGPAVDAIASASVCARDSTSS
jgi:hypothetical protein